MLKTTKINLSIIYQVLISKDKIVDEFGGHNEILRIRVKVKTAKSKSKNLVKRFLVKSKLFTENSELSFFTLKARLALAKLRQAFIKVPILYHSDTN